jgi:hypothetical protein
VYASSGRFTASFIEVHDVAEVFLGGLSKSWLDRARHRAQVFWPYNINRDNADIRKSE